MRQSHTHTHTHMAVHTPTHTPTHTHTFFLCPSISIIHISCRSTTKGCCQRMPSCAAYELGNIWPHMCQPCVHVCMCACMCVCAYVFHYTLISAHLSSSDANRHFIIILTTFLRKHESLARWPNLMLILNAPAQDLSHALSRFRSFSNPIQMFLPSASFYLIFRNFTLC